MSITLHDIDAAEGAVKNIRVALSVIGREIYRMRKGEALEPHYGFYRYSREQFEGSHYCGQDGPDWGVGTPIISLEYYWPRGEDSQYITFPQSYLSCDWRAVEQARCDRERHAEAERKNAAQEEAERQREENERRNYERLKAKFEGEKP